MTRADRPLTVPWGAVTVFVGASMGLAWLVALPVWMMDATSPAYSVVFGLVALAMMFTPALATVIVVFLMRQPATERMRFLGVWPLRPAKRVVWFMALATTVPLIIVLVVTFVSSLLGFVQLDLTNFSGFAGSLSAQLPAGAEELAAAMPPVGVIVAIQLLMVPLAALVNSVPAFGEEIGWRGWLLPALMPLGTWPALIVSGAVWGLWHAPLILLGYNFGLTDWRGVALMVGGCIAWGVLLGWSRLRSGSVWPAVIGHGGLNAAGGTIMLFAASSASVNMGLVGPLGMVSWAVIGVIVVVMVVTGAFAQQPELAGGVAQREVPVPDDSWRRRTAALAAPYAHSEWHEHHGAKRAVSADLTYFGYATIVPEHLVRKSLKRDWGISQRTHAVERTQHGLASISYSVAALAMQRGESYEEFYAKLSRIMPSPESMVFMANAYSVQQGQSGVTEEEVSADELALTIARYANLVRASTSLGLLEEPTAQGYSDVLGLSAALTYDNWHEFGEAYDRGLAQSERHGVPVHESSVSWLLTDAHSPWNREGWLAHPL